MFSLILDVTQFKDGSALVKEVYTLSQVTAQLSMKAPSHIPLQVNNKNYRNAYDEFC